MQGWVVTFGLPFLYSLTGIERPCAGPRKRQERKQVKNHARIGCSTEEHQTGLASILASGLGYARQFQLTPRERWPIVKAGFYLLLFCATLHAQWVNLPIPGTPR